jgi:putative NADH-flavin reductase
MRLFVLGSTGRTGRQIIDVALARGHDVTAFARSPDKVEPRDRLRIVEGDPRSTAGLEHAMAKHDAVLSAIGPRFAQAMRPHTLLTDVAASTVAAMTSAGVSRLGIVSAAVMFDGEGFQFAFFKWFLNHHIRDLTTMEAIVTSSGLSWTIARPPRLVGGSQERYRASRGALPGGSLSTSFRSLAMFLLDAVEGRAHVREIVGVTR